MIKSIFMVGNQIEVYTEYVWLQTRKATRSTLYATESAALYLECT